MNLRVKIFFSFLAAMAVISVFSFFDVFRGVRSALLNDTISPVTTDVIRDADSDGLSDADESYWNTDFQNPDTDGDGFLDGEEVSSGNDPREKSTHPLGDSLDSTVYGGVDPNEVADVTDFNISDDAGGLIMGAVSAGDITREADGTIKDDSLNAIALSVIGNFYKVQDLTYSAPEIKTIDNSEGNQVKYLNSLYEIIKSDLIDFPQHLNTSGSMNDQMPYFGAKGKQFEASYNKASALEVPSGWLETHKSVLVILHKLSFNYLAIANYEQDVLKATAAFNEIANLGMEARSIIKSIQIKAQENKLTLNDEVYKILDMLYQE